MSNYYVDLSATSTGTGTSVSPWDWNQFYADITSETGGTISGGDVILLRGGKDITLSPSGGKSLKIGDNNFQIILSAWDINQGPWRIYDSLNRVALNGVVEIHGGVIISDYTRTITEKANNTPNIILYTSAITNSFIKSERVSLRSFPESSASPLGGFGYCYHNYCSNVLRNVGISGSTIISDSNTTKVLDLDFREPTVLQFKDSVVYINSQNHQGGNISVTTKTPVSAVSAIWNWDVVPASSLSQLSGSSNITSSSNMQYSWSVPITWPSWSADKQDFAYMFLGKNITITGSNEW